MEIKATLNKPYTEEQRIDFIVQNNHQLGYEIKETEEALEAWGYDDSEKLKQAKAGKISVNDTARDEALNQGVEYKDVLFDSDTDQKVNLIGFVQSMDDAQTVVWFGKDNQPLTCNKQDLMNIGGLITQLHSFCWNKNALVKAEINNAKTIEEVEAIEIDYTIPAEEQDSEAVSEGEKSPSDIIESEE